MRPCWKECWCGVLETQITDVLGSLNLQREQDTVTPEQKKEEWRQAHLQPNCYDVIYILAVKLGTEKH